MGWTELSVEVPVSVADIAAREARWLGMEGLTLTRTEPERDDGAVSLAPPTLRAYLPADGQASLREQKLEDALWKWLGFSLPLAGGIRRREIAGELWLDAAKQDFHPLRIGRAIIAPPFQEWEPRDGDILILVEPGTAFGSGYHPSSQSMIAAVQESVRSEHLVLDVGTGTGILATLAAKLGARVTAVDIEDHAVQVARRTMQASGVADRVTVLHGSVEASAGAQYDVVLADLFGPILVDLAQDLARALKPGGYLLASGIYGAQLDDVRHALGDAGLLPEAEWSLQGWYMVGARLSE
jgi:ribosomal protein L11 methyltransferase